MLVTVGNGRSALNALLDAFAHKDPSPARLHGTPDLRLLGL
jgi:hypothetical protein